MNRWTVLFVTLIFASFVALGCSGGGGNPVAPAAGPDLTAQNEGYGSSSHTVLWGFYDMHLDTVSGTLEAVPNRTIQWSANVVQFMNADPANMVFVMNMLNIGVDNVEVDIDVTLIHPFPGMNEFDGYDVKGVFMGQGSGTLLYDSDLDYPVYGLDQFMMDDPINGDGGGPDGYTRWFNAVEFPFEGIEVLAFTMGGYGTKNYTPPGTLCPYKYFTDNLGSHDDPFQYLVDNAAANGVFTAGASNTRNYYLEFPMPDPGANYQYAIVASWEDPLIHPSNAVEAPVISTTVTDSIYWVDAADWGGDLILDIDVWHWTEQPSAIIVESKILAANYNVPMTPTGGGDNYSTYHVEVAADSVTSTLGNEFWVICQYDEEDYVCEYTPTGGAPDAMLASFFRYGLYVSPIPYCTTEIISIVPDQGGLGANVTATITCTDVCDDPTLAASLKMTGQSDIVGANVTYVDNTTFTADFDLTGAELGIWDLWVNDGCCPATDTLADAFEVLELFAIHHDGTGPIGDSVTPDPGNATYDWAVDIGCRPNDGAFYLAWGHTNQYSDISGGYVDRYNAAGDTVLMHAACLRYLDDLYFWYGRVGLDAGSVGSSHGWACVVDPVVHFANDENDTHLNQTYGWWYGNPYWWVQDSCSPAAGNVYSYANFNYFSSKYAVYYEHYYGGNWDNSTANTSYNIIGSNFDGRENLMAFFPVWRTKLMAMAMGDTRDDLWSLNMDAPHVNEYTSWYWIAYSGAQFGNDGTGDGEIAAWTDSGSPDYLRQTGAADLSIRHASNRMYVLDEPTSGNFRIQSFEADGTFKATSGAQACSAYGADTVYRMDYNEFEDLIYVLFDNNTVVAFVDDSL